MSFFKSVGAVLALIAIANLAFIVTIGYVVFHFIQKFW